MAEPIVVCLGFPAFHDETFYAALRAIDPRIEPVALPVDPAGAWLGSPPAEPCDEPPPWATTVAPERRRVLERAEVLIALHAPKDLPALAPRLRWIHCVGAGTEQFVRVGVSSARTVVTNSSGIGARTISEFVLGRLLSVWKSFRTLDEHQQAHRWAPLYGRTFAGSTLGIVGLGAIGIAVAERARAFGVKIAAIRRSWKPGLTSPHADELFPPERLHEMLGRCDAVVVCAPHSPETERLIDAAALAAMRPGAVLVNVARGALVDAAALADAMRRGHLGAAVLDVFDEEPLPASSPLWDLPNTYMSSHCSTSIDRYVDDLFELFQENVRRYAAGEPLRNAIDMNALGYAKA